MGLGLSVIIVNWNTKDLLKNCLQSIYERRREHSFEVIVIDNGSTDGSPQMVKKQFPSVKLIQNNSNVGFAKANNQGIEVSKGRYILLLNSDTVVLEDAMEKMVKGMDEHRNLGACTSQAINPDGTSQFKGRSLPTIPDIFLKLFLPNKIYLAIMRTIFEWFHRQQTQLLEIGRLTGAVCMVRREVIQQVGGLDETLPIYAEDSDWCYRIRNAGWKIGCFPDAKIIHLGQQTSQQIPVTAELASRRAIYAYFKKHYGKPHILTVAILIKISSLIKYIIWTIIYFALNTNKALLRRKAYKILLTTPLTAPIDLVKAGDEH